MNTRIIALFVALSAATTLAVSGASPQSSPVLDPGLQPGKAVYEQHCAACHGWAGNYKAALFQGSKLTGPGFKGWVAEDPFHPNLDEKAHGREVEAHAYTKDEEPAYWNHGDIPLIVNTPNPDERNATFFKLHLAWFREWKLEQALQNFVEEFPLLTNALNVLAWRKARTKGDEGAELYVSSETGRNAVVAMHTERFERDELLDRFLRHEFTHLSDMVDPNFGYSPELRLHGPVSAPQRLVRERYRLLWDITIDGRLTRAAHVVNTRRGQHETLFNRA